MVNLSRKKYVRLLVVALIICLISMIGASPVSYTHLDVYKRQGNSRAAIYFKSSIVPLYGLFK